MYRSDQFPEIVLRLECHILNLKSPTSFLSNVLSDLGNPLLLRDYEEGKDESDELRHKLDILKRTHAELTLSLSGVKKKIEQARNSQS